MLFLPLWFVSLFLVPWKFCTGSHRYDWQTIKGDSAKGYKKVLIVLGLTIKNVMSFFCYLFSFILFGLIAIIVLVTPWRLKTNLCTNLAGVYKDIMAQEGDEGYEVVDRLFDEMVKQTINLIKDLLVIGFSPTLIVSAQRWSYLYKYVVYDGCSNDGLLDQMWQAIKDVPWLLTLFLICALTPWRLFKFLELSAMDADGKRFTFKSWLVNG